MIKSTLKALSRVRRSTYFLAAPALLVLVLVNIAGEDDFVWDDTGGLQQCDHGWPLVFLHRTYRPGMIDEVGARADLLGVWPWSASPADEANETAFPSRLLAAVREVRVAAAFADIAVAAGLIALLAALWEFRLRRGLGPFSVSMLELTAVPVVVALLLPWGLSVYRRGKAQEALWRRLAREGQKVRLITGTPGWLQWCIGSERLSFLDRIGGLEFQNLGDDENELAEIAACPALRALTFPRPVKDRSDEWRRAAMRTTLGGLRHLVLLDLSDLGESEVRDEDLALLSPLRSLTYLDLSDSAVTDIGLTEVARLTRLRHLRLNMTSVSRDGITRLCNLKDLEELGIAETRVRAGDMQLLTAFHRLRVLAISGDIFTPDAARSLDNLGTIEKLQLCFDSDASTIRSATELTSLRQLYLCLGTKFFTTNFSPNGIQVNPDAVAQLHKRSPELKIYRQRVLLGIVTGPFDPFESL